MRWTREKAFGDNEDDDDYNYSPYPKMGFLLLL